MDRNQLEVWLKELYQLDPHLTSFEEQLIEIISQMQELQTRDSF